MNWSCRQFVANAFDILGLRLQWLPYFLFNIRYHCLCKYGTETFTANFINFNYFLLILSSFGVKCSVHNIYSFPCRKAFHWLYIYYTTMIITLRWQQYKKMRNIIKTITQHTYFDSTISLKKKIQVYYFKLTRTTITINVLPSCA